MIKKNIGKLRNLVSRGKQLYVFAKQIINSEELLIISLKDKKVSCSGNVSSTPMTLVLLGKALGTSYVSAIENGPYIPVDQYVTQPAEVAIKHIEAHQAL